jgi:predicted RNA-binding Zn ribbon-like protein
MVATVVEDDVWRTERSSPQPGGRPPAPGALAVLQAFLNSHFDLVEHWGADLLASPDGLRAWLQQRRLISDTDSVTPGDVARALTVREALRQLIAWQSGNAPELSEQSRTRVTEAMAEASFTLGLLNGTPSLVPAGSGPFDRALGVLLALAVSAMLDGSWSRLKACPGHHCGWVFYDRSRNNSGRWCSMTVCGGREKSRSHYHRHRTRGD